MCGQAIFKNKCVIRNSGFQKRGKAEKPFKNKKKMISMIIKRKLKEYNKWLCCLK